MAITGEMRSIVASSPDMIGGVVATVLSESSIALDSSGDARMAQLNDFYGSTFPVHILAILQPQAGQNQLPIDDRLCVTTAWCTYGDPANNVDPYGDSGVITALAAYCETSLDGASIRGIIWQELGG